MEDLWVPFFGNGSGVWTPAGLLNSSDPYAAPIGLEQTSAWRSFGLQPMGRKVQGGYVIEWAGGQVQFVTVRGAGHLVPTYRPAAAYTLMMSFQSEQLLPTGFPPPGRR